MRNHFEDRDSDWLNSHEGKFLECQILKNKNWISRASSVSQILNRTEERSLEPGDLWHPMAGISSGISTLVCGSVVGGLPEELLQGLSLQAGKSLLENALPSVQEGAADYVYPHS